MIKRLFIFLIIGTFFIKETSGQATAPSKSQLMEYLRSKLLKVNMHNSTSGNYRKVNPSNSYAEIFADTSSCTITLYYQSGEKQIIYFANLDAGSLSHDYFSFEGAFRGVSRLNLNAINGKNARIWYNSNGTIDTAAANVARFFYDGDTDKKEIERIEKAILAIIKICGGKQDVELF